MLVTRRGSKKDDDPDWCDEDQESEDEPEFYDEDEEAEEEDEDFTELNIK